MTVLPFDAHNHVQLGPTPPHHALLPASATSVLSLMPSQATVSALSGMSIMSTHPRDFSRVLELSKDLLAQFPGVHIVPCFGIHPWWVHELSDKEWSVCGENQQPAWIANLEALLVSQSNSIVGEIGLDGFHFDPTTKDLVCPMDKQAEAFLLQLQIAARTRRPVSIHSVQSFGKLFDCIKKAKESTSGLPPKLYFHAFGGKPAVVNQLLALCGNQAQVYFGFAAVINFRSPKTAALMRHVGLERLVLESDHEDAAFVPASIDECIDYMAEALSLSRQEVITQTTRNAFDLYGLSWEDD
jgi:Tat protein secretion system quality control protein TatD with DNase activity